MQSTAKQHQLLRIELENKIAENTQLRIMVSNFQQQENTYKELIDRAKKHELMFKQSFQDAAEFLQS